MARKLKITVTTASNLVVVQDYDNATGVIYQMLNCGTGEFTMEQTGNVDLTNAAAAITFVHRDGARFGAAKIGDIESVTINGVAATITNLSLVRDAVAPYFFSVGSSAYPFYKEMVLGPSELGTIGSGIEMLPAVAGHYYKWSIDFEFTYGSVIYSLSGNGITIMSGTVVVSTINGNLIVFTQNRIVENVVPEPQTGSTRVPQLVGNALILDTTSGANATLGDGTLLVKIRYDIVKFRV